MSKRTSRIGALDRAHMSVNFHRWERDRARAAWESAEREHVAALEWFMATLVERIEADDMAGLRELAHEVRAFQREQARDRSHQVGVQ